MTFPTNVLQQVATYQRGGLAWLLNSYAFIERSNKKFQNFENEIANLGSSITFDLPPRLITSNTLVANFQAATQRVQTLSVNQSANTSYSFTNQERIFNVDKQGDSYLPQFVKSAVANLGSIIERDIARNAISGVINSNTSSPGFGTANVTSGPYRFYGNGFTAINSYGQLAQMIANFKDYGAVDEDIEVFLPMVDVPAIVNSGLNQFAIRRNDDIAMSWEIGEFGTPPVKYYQSNLLPIQYSGNTGNLQQVLTLVSVNDPTGQNVTQMTFSGASASDANAVKAGDLFQFQDGVSGQTNIRFLTFIGYTPSQQPVQFRATTDAASTAGGNVTVNITPALSWVAGPNQNLSVPLNPGMRILGLPNHRAGLVVGGRALFLAMPRLPDQPPFATASEYDMESAASLRLTYGAIFGQNQLGFVHDAVWDSVCVPEYTMRIIFPM